VIILVTGSSRSKECAAAIERKTHQNTKVVSSLPRVIDCLQQQDIEALVIDESFQQVESGIDTVVAAHSGTAVPIYVNLSLHGADRVAVEVSCGLQRLVQERLSSMRAAAAEFRNQLRGEVTSILLNTELAMQDRSLLPGVSDKLRAVHEMAERMRQKLEATSPGTGKAHLRPRLVTKAGEAPVTR
jgi:hypothetical protein